MKKPQGTIGMLGAGPRENVLFSGDCVIRNLTRRHWLTLAGTLVGSTACGHRKGTGYPGSALIADSANRAVSVVDLISFSLKRTIPLDSAPTAILPGSEGSRVYVLTPDSGSVHTLTSDLKPVASRRWADELSNIRLSSN